VLTADDVLNAQAAEWDITPDTSRRVMADPNAKPLIVPAALQLAPTSVNSNPSPPLPPADQQPAIPPVAKSGTPDQSPAQPPVVVSNNPPDLNAINSERNKLTSAETRPLDSAAFTTDQDLSKTDKPYQITGVFQPAPGTGDWKILVQPGVEIRGGKIDMGRHGAGSAQLLLAGTSSQPIILRNVEIDQPLSGVFDASNVIFDQCTFRKASGKFGIYSSKWPMDHCLLYKCTFVNFKAVDYGFKLTNCTFVDMNLPEIVQKAIRGKPVDDMDHLRKNWNIIQSCNFVNCTVFPTVFWCAENSNFWNCTFLPGFAFESETPTTVVAFVSGTTGLSPDRINLENPAQRAPLTIMDVNTPFPVARWDADCPIPELRHDDRLAQIVLARSDTR